MNILIVEDVLNGHNGSFKIMRNIAYGFKKNNDVKIIYFGKSQDYKNVLPLLDGFDYHILYNKYFSFFESQIKKIILKKHLNFKIDDLPIFFLEFYLFKYLKKINYNPDFIIFSNPFASLALIFGSKYKSIVYLHEAPLFDDFNYIVRKFIHLYLNILNIRSTYISISMGTTGKINKNFTFNIGTKPPIAFLECDDCCNKEKFILLDTRWTANRNPLFVLEIAKLMKNVKIIMHGVFVDNEIKDELNRIIEKKQYNIELISNDTNEELINLYKKAMIVMRWSGINETGNSLSIIDAISYNCIPVMDKNLGISKFIEDNISPDLVVNDMAKEFVKIALKIMNENNFYKGVLSNVINCKKRYSWENYANNLLNNINNI